MESRHYRAHANSVGSQASNGEIVPVPEPATWDFLTLDAGCVFSTQQGRAKPETKTVTPGIQ